MNDARKGVECFGKKQKYTLVREIFKGAEKEKRES